MKKLFLSLLLAGFLVQQADCQKLKLNLFGGGGGSSPYRYSFSYGTIFMGEKTENFSIHGFYTWGLNISYPILMNEFGIFFETNNRFAEASPISYKSNIAAAGLFWRKPASKIEFELMGGFGYSWDKYKLSYPNNTEYSITTGIPIFHGGFNIFFPINNFLGLTIGGRITRNNNPHVWTPSNFISSKGLTLPSWIYTGTAGIDINIFNNWE